MVEAVLYSAFGIETPLNDLEVLGVVMFKMPKRCICNQICQLNQPRCFGIEEYRNFCIVSRHPILVSGVLEISGKRLDSHFCVGFVQNDQTALLIVLASIKAHEKLVEATANLRKCNLRNVLAREILLLQNCGKQANIARVVALKGCQSILDCLDSLRNAVCIPSISARPHRRTVKFHIVGAIWIARKTQRN